MGRNWEWSFNHGREQRLKREREAAEQGIAECDVDRSVPLHSRDGTMQSQFKKGWCSVTPSEIYDARNRHRFNILTTCNGKAAEHCARLRALFSSEVKKDEPPCHSR
ncbi:hypothetical protein ACV1DV_06475 [Aeromonas veronii]